MMGRGLVGDLPDIPGATWVGSPNFWQGRNGYPTLAIVCHIAQGSIEALDATFQDPQTAVSTHFGVGSAGELHQYVHLADSAWGNGIVEPGNTMPSDFPPGVDPNWFTWSIEHAGFSGVPLTEVQYQTSLGLISQLVALAGFVPDADHVIGHYRISPVTRAYCPGPAFPWDRLLSDLQGGPPPPAPGGQSLIAAIAGLGLLGGAGAIILGGRP
jgi:N-acetylmuramoyl-L-alanine amidase